LSPYKSIISRKLSEEVVSVVVEEALKNQFDG
jgi:hypothetical protein